MKFFSDLKNSGVIKACGFSTHNDYMNLPERNNSEVFYDTIMVPFNPKGSYVHSQNGRYSEWDQKKLISILAEAGNKGIGVIAMKTYKEENLSPSPDQEPTFMHAVEWVLQNKFIRLQPLQWQVSNRSTSISHCSKPANHNKWPS